MVIRRAGSFRTAPSGRYEQCRHHARPTTSLSETRPRANNAGSLTQSPHRP
ncbi:MAG: hypothetical protein H6650_11050 [Ardenticatenales bacterium]|nr:hypothetical protein [Ardenticatenales bacterium]